MKIAAFVFLMAQVVIAALLFVEVTSLRKALAISPIQITAAAENEALDTNFSGDLKTTFRDDLASVRADLRELRALLEAQASANLSRECEPNSAGVFPEKGLTKDELALINAGTLYSNKDDEVVPEGMVVEPKFKSLEQAVEALK